MIGRLENLIVMLLGWLSMRLALLAGEFVVWALTISQVLCGQPPYHDLSNNEMVMLAVVEGVRPKKPWNVAHLGFTKALWATVERCWREDRMARPGVGDILSSLNDALPSWLTRQQTNVRRRRTISTILWDTR